MFFALLTLVLLDPPAAESAQLSLPPEGRHALPEACPLPHAARRRAPGSSRRRFRDCLVDDDDSDGRGRTAPSHTLLPRCTELPCPAHALPPRTGRTRRLATVPLVYALCTLRI